MKINWGTGIAIFLMCFVSFLGFAVYKASQNRVDLTEANYYRSDNEFQAQLKAKQRSLELPQQVLIQKEKENVEILFPNDRDDIQGTVVFYKPNNSKMDKKFPLKLDNNQVAFFNVSTYPKGEWIVKVDWHSNNLDYYNSQAIHL